MTTFIIIFGVIAVVGVAVVVMFTADRLPGIAPATHDEAPREEPQFPMTAADLAAVKFSVRFRGYDMQEVDEFIDGLIDQLAVAEARSSGNYLSTGWASAPEPDEGDSTDEGAVPEQASAEETTGPIATS